MTKKEITEIEHFRAKKALGQNWLNSSRAIKTIVDTANLTAEETVLEIGPGQGALTKNLLATGAKVLAIEKDTDLIDKLLEKFALEITNERLLVAHGDILDIKISKLFSDNNHQLETKKYKLVANIPYYITGQIIKKFLAEEENQPTRIVLTVQKEVAQRIVASDKKESLLSISVKAYGTPQYIKTIPAGAFKPKPKVDSAILLIENISRDFFQTLNKSEKEFFTLLKKAFGQKRKLLKNNLALKETKILNACQISPKARAENLSLTDWKCLIEKLDN